MAKSFSLSFDNLSIKANGLSPNIFTFLLNNNASNPTLELIVMIDSHLFIKPIEFCEKSIFPNFL